MSAKTSFDLGIDVKKQNRKLYVLTNMCDFLSNYIHVNERRIENENHNSDYIGGKGL